MSVVIQLPPGVAELKERTAGTFPWPCWQRFLELFHVWATTGAVTSTGDCWRLTADLNLQPNPDQTTLGAKTPIKWTVGATGRMWSGFSDYARDSRGSEWWEWQQRLLKVNEAVSSSLLLTAGCLPVHRDYLISKRLRVQTLQALRIPMISHRWGAPAKTNPRLLSLIRNCLSQSNSPQTDVEGWFYWPLNSLPFNWRVTDSSFTCIIQSAKFKCIHCFSHTHQGINHKSTLASSTCSCHSQHCLWSSGLSPLV